MYGLDSLIGGSTGGQYAAMVADAPADTATPTPSTAASPGGSSSKAAEVAQNPTTWLIVTLGAGLALYWYGTGQLKVSL